MSATRDERAEPHPDAGKPRVKFERERYPIVVLRVPPHGDVEGVHAWYDETERTLREATSPFALVHDLRAITLGDITSANRRAVAERSARLVDFPGIEWLAADARIVSGQFAVSAMTTIAWMAGRVPWAQASFANEERALAWAHARIVAADGKPLPRL